MFSWAAKRRLQYFSGVFTVLFIIIGVPTFLYLYDRPNCFDSEQNGSELGIDCGGSCTLLCEFQTVSPVVLWSRSFEVTPGFYSSLAYVENPNTEAYTESISYEFELFDENNFPIAKREGETFILPGGVTPIFESNISIDEKIPVRTFFDFTSSPIWLNTKLEKNPLSISNKTLRGAESSPRVDAVLENTSVRNIDDIEAVIVVFNALGNAIASSKTLIEFLPKQSTADLVFTWPNPFSKELESCSIPVDVALLLDVSGSMNNDNIDPPQPLTDAKEAAKSFVIRLNEADKSSLISFATFANTDRMLNFDHTKTIKEIDNLAILPKEETGSTNIGDAISHAIDELIPVSRTEDGQAFRQVIVLLTDGIANAPKSPGGEEYALSESIRAKDRGYIIYTIGLGDKVNTSFLEEVASAKEQSYKAATSKDLNRIYRQVSDSICERGPASVEIIPRSLDILR